ncbi:MAG: hypothetical protein ABEK16_00575 [Candidatus Nanohalobium sp.]
MRRKVSLLVFIFLLASPVLGQDSINKTYTTGNFTSATPPENDSIGAGTVMEMDVSAPRAPSDTWAGVFGNVTAQYIVGQDTQSPFFSWGLLDARYVYASSQPLDFSGDWSPGNISYMQEQYPFLKNGSEEVSETFTSKNGSIDSGFQPGAVNDTLASFTYNSTGDPAWETLYLSDGNGGFFAGPIRNGVAFNGFAADYQLILPESEYGDGGKSYSMYLELE